MKKELTAFIFARGGSKGVVDKNIRSVAGKPLLAYSIQCALGSKYIGRVIVSTDSERIAGVAKENGAGVLMRPENLASDSSPEILSWKHAITSYQATLGDVFISLPATSPLRTSMDVDHGIERFQKGECDVLFGITPSNRSPYLNMVTVNASNLLEVVIPGVGAKRRQDVPRTFDVTTCVYIAQAEYILNTENIMDGRVGYTEIPNEHSLDIDTEYDLYLADLILRHPFTKG